MRKGLPFSRIVEAMPHFQQKNFEAQPQKSSKPFRKGRAFPHISGQSQKKSFAQGE
jgi:hypothetical protein